MRNDIDPTVVIPDQADAEYKNGLLKIDVPKRKKGLSKKKIIIT
jgi:HSP20 family molecular chaperone IbpA